MAIPVNISQLLSGNVVESTRVEFKSGYNPDAILHTICAFANDIDNIGQGIQRYGRRQGRQALLQPQVREHGRGFAR